MNRKIMLPYYPYGLRVVSTRNYKETFLIRLLDEDCYVISDYWRKKYKVSYESEDYKPILYPISHVCQTIRTNNKKVIPIDLICEVIYKHLPFDKENCSINDRLWIKEITVNYLNNLCACPFTKEIMNDIYETLYTLHFDISNLIQKGEAEDVTKLSFNPYEVATLE